MISEIVSIAGVDVELYRITGHPVTDLVILKNGLTSLDISRLQLAVGGTLKGRTDTVIETGQTVTGLYLNIFQAKLTDINKWGSDYFKHLLVSLTDVIAERTAADVTLPDDVVGSLNALISKVTIMDGKITTMDGKITTMDGKITTMDGKIGDIHTVAVGING